MEQVMHTIHVTLHFRSHGLRLVCMQAVFASRLGSNGSRLAASNIHRTSASTSTVRLHAQLRRTVSLPACASGSDSAAATPAPQIATESSASPPPESADKAPRFPLSAAVVAAAAAALAAGRDLLAAAGRELLAAAEAVDELPVFLTLLAYAGSSVWRILSLAPIDPIAVPLGCGGFAAGAWLFHIIGGPDPDSPRSTALNTACRTYYVWQLAWHLTGAFLPV